MNDSTQTRTFASGKSMTVGKRLLEERRRLGLSQEALGAAGGVAKGAQINYEKDARAPDTDYLQGVAAAGVDICYVITGQRRLPVAGSEREMAMLIQAINEVVHGTRPSPVDDEAATATLLQVRDAYQGVYDLAAKKGATPGRSLSAAELRLLSHYEACTAAGRKAVERVASLEAERQRLKQKHGDAVLSQASISIRGDNNTVGSRNKTSK